MTNMKETAVGGIFVFFGIYFLISTLGTLEVGSALRMGPGYFPMLLSGLLILVGLIIAVRGISTQNIAAGPVAWRGMVFVAGAPVFFGAMISRLGLILCLFLTCMIAVLGSRGVSPVSSILISLVLTAFCVALFSYGLGLPIPLFGSWFGA
ncbi:tripartite tricarboxylate transporter TctB family protein [Pseudochelatococcus sp. B33]